ncbi:hypothetical protein FKM82_013925 [Ascaphus truei]
MYLIISLFIPKALQRNPFLPQGPGTDCKAGPSGTEESYSPGAVITRRAILITLSHLPCPANSQAMLHCPTLTSFIHQI